MVIKSLQQLAKEQANNKNSFLAKKKLEFLEYKMLDKNEKLKTYIQNIKTSIKNCEYDLSGMFKNNCAIEKKLEGLKLVLEQKMKELNDLEKETWKC